ncbi:CamS family sex pheromone protein [Bacillus sp. EAC]|uniref:CamS family sex pheromone protein n=1 Tax=Bacillus sp. EAC TaxID=1978338 RepID=UPI000B44BA06|nr:CamS family sex pheromone protein [Bacillus sp. EAC]
MKNRIGILLCCLSLVLSGCSLSLKNEDKVVQENGKNKNGEDAIIPRYSISNDYYKTILPFKPSKTRGAVVSNIDNRLDINEFELGLMRVVQDQYSTKDYLYQEGQLLDKKTVESWLKRKYTPAQYKEKVNANKNAGLNKTINNDGLNPIENTSKSLSADKKAEAAPIYLNHILEQDYLKKSGKEVKLQGVAIGLAMNSVYYYQEEHGYPRELEISQSEMLKQGKAMAQEILTRLRKMDEFRNIPITFAIFRQQKQSSVVPGTYVAKATVSGNESSISGWDKINEKYYLFPSAAATRDYRDDAMKMVNFKSDIENYFPNYTGVVGTGFYKDNELIQLKIDIPMQFYSKAEVIAFTQYVAGLMMDHFPSYLKVETNVFSANGQEALIVKEVDAKEPSVHIYN